MKQCLIILDGARGAGKSTVSGLLKDKLVNTAFVGLDLVRNLITKSQATDAYNQIAYDVIFSMTESFLKNGVSIVMDSGLNEQRESLFRKLAEDAQVPVLSYSLSAPKEVLWERIQKRGQERGKMPNPERFEYTYAAQQSKDFHKFTMIDTTSTSPDAIVEKILDDVNNLSI